MDMNNNNAIVTIAESIISACKELISKAEYDKTLETTVVSGSSKAGHVGIIYKGNVISVPNYSGKEVTINDNVMVTLPSGNYKKMYVSSVMNDVVGGGSGGGSGSGTSTDDYNSLSNRPKINNIILSGNKTTADLGIRVPKSVSELTNDMGYITGSDLPSVPTKTSELTNDSGFITSADIPAPPDVPTKTSQLTNDSGFITAADIPAQQNIPTKTSQLRNDSGFITVVDVPTPTAATTTYDNSSSGLTATTTQAAIDELVASGGGGGTPTIIGDDYVSKDEFVQFVNLLVEELSTP